MHPWLEMYLKKLEAELIRFLQDLDKEVALHRMVGSFQEPPLHNLHISLLGIVHKNGQANTD